MSINIFSMKRVKRVLTILLAVFVCVYSFSACSGEHEENVEMESNVPSKTEDNNQLFHTQSPLYKEFSLLDSDGDGTPDYLCQQSLLDIFGGQGQYHTVIYGKSDADNKYDKVVFDSAEYLSAHKNMDIEVTVRDGAIIFRHQETGYEKEYVVQEDTYLFSYLFNADGSPKGSPNFMIDSFKTVEVVDINNDGVEEILLEQYASMGWHANHFADCISVFNFTDDGKLTLISIELVIK